MPPFDCHRLTVWSSTSPRHALATLYADVRGKRGFAHAGTAGEDDQIGLLQTAHHAVEIVQPCGDARQLSVTLESVRGHIDRGGECLRKALETTVVAAGLRQFV